MVGNSNFKTRRILILASKMGYQTRAFAEVARKLGVEVVFGTDRCHKLDDPWADGAMALHFEKEEEAARDPFGWMKQHLIAPAEVDVE